MKMLPIYLCSHLEKAESGFSKLVSVNWGLLIGDTGNVSRVQRVWEKLGCSPLAVGGMPELLVMGFPGSGQL